MKLKQLEKASIILEKIKVLDKEVNELNKIAIKVSEGNSFPKIKFTIKDKEDKCKNDILDEDGSLKTERTPIQTYFIMNFGSNGEIKSANSEEKTQSIDSELNDSMAFMVLDLMLKDKEFKRNILIIELEKLGFKIN